MNIILLSGGSGKRLWPLSNGVRSKQFIKMFKNESGVYESMVQRVYRQIKTADPGADITIATGKKQVSAIHNQLGGRVSVCVEPERRDTFAAVALAAAYLRSEKGIGEDEPVAVCPVDPYVDQSYFERIKELAQAAGEGRFRLNLMGAEPSYPSAKYGYIIPESAQELSAVREFKEKPDEKTAEEYIKRGALWNCGVFAFKLGYILEKARAYVDFKDYGDMLKRYGEFEKTSFDYAVSEKEDSIGCMRYSGEWKDIGSWNTFCEEMSGNIIGKAQMDDTCANTNIVNELNIPVLCMGCRDMVIAASGDGILVSDKKQSSYMKPYVDKIEESARFAEKSWGSFTALDVQPESMVIRIILLPGHGLHYHSHEHRDEVWNIVSGRGTAVIDGEERAVSAGDVIKMNAGCRHTVKAHTRLEIIEVQLGKDISVKDKKKHQL